MKNLINTLLFLLIVVFFSIYLKIDLQSVASLASDISVDVSLLNISIFSIFIYSISFIFNTNCKIYNKDVFVIKSFFYFVYIISFLYSFIHPIGAKLLYILIILPYILYIWMYISCKIVNKKIILIAINFLFIYTVYIYFQEYAKIMFFSLKETPTTNASYFIMYLLPLMLVINKKYIQIIAFLITIIVVFSSSKRGGSIAVILALFVYLIIEFRKISKNKARKSYILGLILILLLGSTFIINFAKDYIQELAVVERFSEIEDDGGSGRTNIYIHVFTMIGNSNIINLFFGHGWNRVEHDSILHLSAHNDLLEITYDFGLLGLFLYLSIFILLVKKTIFFIKKQFDYASAMAVSMVLFTINSMGSHIVIYPAYMCLFTIFWGYIIRLDRERIIKSYT